MLSAPTSWCLLLVPSQGDGPLPYSAQRKLFVGLWHRSAWQWLLKLSSGWIAGSLRDFVQ